MLFHNDNNTEIVLFEDTRFSWTEADEMCASYNSTLLSFSSYNDVATVQALIMEAFGSLVKSHIHIGLKRNTKVNDSSDFNSLVIKNE